jgi:(S)-citramalyl-CoA lyase
MDAPSPRHRPRPPRSVLFCPGSRPDRFDGAMAAGADAVCLDLEDGVAPDAREGARDAVVGWLEGRAREPGGAAAPELMVRVNDPRSPDGGRDLEALATLEPTRRPDVLMVPKVDGPEMLGDLIHAMDALGGNGAAGSGPVLLPLIETAMGLHRVEEVALAGLPLGALAFGGMDLAAELGARLEWEPLLLARSRLVHAAALAEVGALDVPWPWLEDSDGLRDEVRRAARLGFTGKLAIHPGQVPHIHAALTPGAEELAAARRVVEAAARSDGGVLVVDGRMVDRPVILAAQRVLSRAGEAAGGGAP